MAGPNVGTAYLTILPTMRGAQAQIVKELGGAGSEGGRAASRGFLGAMGGVPGQIAKMAATGGILIGGAAAAGITKAIGSAAALEQSVGAIDTVFGSFAGQMHAMSASAATDVGLTKNEFNELGTLIGTQLKNGGTAMDELAPKTSNLISTGADLASMFGGTTSEAVEALSSALKGERDPIERYGVSLNQAAIDAKAAELGFEKVGNSLSAEANQAATLALIMEQTSAAHGNFAKENDTLSGQLERMKSSWGNIVATIGTAFLPVAMNAAKAINEHVMPALQAFADGLGGEGGLLARMQGMGGVIGPIFSAIGTGFQAATAIAGPAIDALGGSFSGAAGTVAQFAGAISPVSMIFQALQPVLPLVGQMVGTLAGVFVQLASALVPLALQLSGALIPALTQIAAAVFPALLQIVNAVVGVLPQLIPPLVSLVGAAVQVVAAVAPLIAQLATSLLPLVANAATTILPMLVTAFAGIVTAIVPVVNVLTSILAPLLSNVIIPLVTFFAQSILGNITGAFQGITNVISGAVALVGAIFRGDWASAWTALQQIVGGAVQAVWNLAQLWIAGGLVKVVSGGLAAVKLLFSGGWSSIVGLAKTAWSNLGGIASAGVTQVVKFIGQLPGNIKGLFKNAGSLLLQSGRDVVNGLLRGAGEILPKLGRFFLDKIPGWIRGPFERALGIHSPSRVFAGYGAFIGEGLIGGVGSMSGAVAASSRALALTASGSASEALRRASLDLSMSDGMREAGQDAGDALARGLVESQRNVRAAMNRLAVAPSMSSLQISTEDDIKAERQAAANATAAASAEALKNIKVLLDSRLLVGGLAASRAGKEWKR